MSAAVRASPLHPAVAGRLGLGAARFGLKHDAADPRRRMSDAEAFATIALAADAGVRVIDACPRRGEGEAVVGRAAPRNPPAPPPFRLQTRALPVASGLLAVETAARTSLARMGVLSAAALFVETAADLLARDGAALWKRLQKLKAEGLYAAIGICAGFADDPIGLARRFKPDLIQLPVNLLDQRLISAGVAEKLADMGVEVQFRSVFARGLLFLPGHGLPKTAATLGPRLSRIRRVIAEAGCDPLHASLAFALSRPEASTVVVSVNSAAELKAILAAAAAPAPNLDWAALSLDDPAALDRAA